MKKTLAANANGQFVIEAVLLMVVTTGLLMWGSKQFRDKKLLANLIGGPWEQVSGMIEAGVWESPAKARPLHPAKLDRAVTYRPD